MTAVAIQPRTRKPSAAKWPAFAVFVLAAVVFSRLSESIETTAIPVPVSAVLALFVILAFLGSRSERRHHRPMLAVMTALAAVSLAVAAFSSIGARDPSLSIEAIARQLAAGMVGVAVVMLVTDRRRLELALSGVVVATLVVSAVNCFQAATGTYESTYLGLARAEFAAVYTDMGWRLGGPPFDPNFFAQMLAPGVAVAVVRLIAARRSGRRDHLALAATLAGTAALLLSYSRGGLVALGLALLLVTFRWLRWRAVAPVVVAAVLLVTMAPDAVVGRVGTAAVAAPRALDGQLVEDSAINGRASEALVGFEQFSDNWLLGVGIGNYELHYLDYAGTLGLDDRGEPRSAHSIVVETVAEQGLVGLGTFSMIVLLAFAAIRSLRQKSVMSDPRLWWCALAVEAGLVAHLATALFLHNSYPRPMWLLLGLAFACGQVQPADRSSAEKPVGSWA